jgi:hypothetical protein
MKMLVAGRKEEEEDDMGVSKGHVCHHLLLSGAA